MSVLAQFVLFFVLLFGCGLAAATLDAQKPAAADQKQAQPAKPNVAFPTKGPDGSPYSSTEAQLRFEKQKNQVLQYQALDTAQQKQIAALPDVQTIETNTAAARAQLQQEYTKLDKEISDWAASVRKANGWDESYVYNRQADQWEKTEKPPAKPAAPAK